MARSRPTHSTHHTAAGDGRASFASDSGATDARVVRALGGCVVCVAAGASGHEIAALFAAGQRGTVSRWQLLEAGLSASAIDRRAAAGLLLRLHRGVYGTPECAQIPHSADAAAVLACGPGGLLSHHSAAVLWGLRPGVADPVHVTVPAPRSGPARQDGIRVHRTKLLIPADAAIHAGLPVTSPARTILDLAAGLPDREVELLLDEGLFVRRLLTARDIDAILDRAGTHPGAARLRRLAGGHEDSTTESDPEEILLGLIRAAGLPPPRHHVWLLGYGLDLYWPELKLAVEVDAYGTHGSRRRFEADRRRDARLLAEAGVIVIRFTRRQILERPYEVIATLARAMGAAAA